MENGKTVSPERWNWKRPLKTYCWLRPIKHSHWFVPKAVWRFLSVQPPSRHPVRNRVRLTEVQETFSITSLPVHGHVYLTFLAQYLTQKTGETEDTAREFEEHQGWGQTGCSCWCNVTWWVSLAGPHPWALPQLRPAWRSPPRLPAWLTLGHLSPPSSRLTPIMIIFYNPLSSWQNGPFPFGHYTSITAYTSYFIYLLIYVRLPASPCSDSFCTPSTCYRAC